MRTLIALAFAAFVATFAFSAPASAADDSVKCLSGTSVGEWNVRWIREGRGSCNGQILVSDTSKVANLAARGATELRVAFYIPEKCDSGWASVPTKVSGNTISYYPWRKTCKAGHFNPRVVK